MKMIPGLGSQAKCNNFSEKSISILGKMYFYQQFILLSEHPIKNPN